MNIGQDYQTPRERRRAFRPATTTAEESLIFAAFVATFVAGLACGLYLGG